MLGLLLATLAAAAQPEAAKASSPGRARASGRATVTLLEARIVPMSAESMLRDRGGRPQRTTTVRLADGEHPAILLEFE